MEIKYHKDFLKNYKKRIAPNPSLSENFDRQLRIFLQSPHDTILKDHKLAGRKKSLRAFSVTGDIRVVYGVANNEIWLYDVGTHNQVY